MVALACNCSGWEAKAEDQNGLHCEVLCQKIEPKTSSSFYPKYKILLIFKICMPYVQESSNNIKMVSGFTENMHIL